MKRYPDWRSRLHDLIEERRRLPFSEKNNCGVFVFDCIQAMTGVDIFAKFRGKFESIAEGFVLLRRAGYEDLPAFFNAHFPEVHPSTARAGDVMLFHLGDLGWACGIANGERVTVMAREGLGTVARSQALKAFRIP